MNSLRLARSLSPLLLLAGVLAMPGVGQAQTSEERREAEIRARLAQMERSQEARLARLHEALSRAEEELAAQESRTQEQMAVRLAGIEEALAQELRARERALSRARERDGEARIRVREALERARQSQERARRIRLHVQSKVRLGITLDGRQNQDIDAQGAMIRTVTDESPAQEAGLEDGDLITHLDGHHLLDPLPDEMENDLDEDYSFPVQRLMALVKDLDDGQEVEIRYLREGSARTATVQATQMDEPSVLVIGSDLRDRGRRGVIRIHPDDERTWTLSEPDRRVLSLQLSRLEDLQHLEELEGLAIELKELEALEGLRVKLEGLDADSKAFTLRATPGEGPRALRLGAEGTPRIMRIGKERMGYGLEVTELNPALGEYFSAEQGVLVLEVEEDSPLPVVPGDVIQAVDGRQVTSERALRRILGSYEDGESFTLRVIRQGSPVELEVSRG